MKTVAVIDDDIYIGDMVEELLKKEGYGVLRAYSGTEAVYLLRERRPDLILLDLMLPGLSGEEVLPLVLGIPVIVVSAKADVGEKVKLLRKGAADYITKPFDTRELLARMEVQLRMAASSPGTFPSLAFGELRLDTVSRSLRVGEEPVRLTRTEYAILKLLMQNPRQVLTKSLLLERIGTDTPDCTESSLKIHVSNLRKKLREAGGKDYIEAVWGIGYKMMEETEK
ncbi:MAG: response regulator transcription factor [Lachnospiraceae bacterium]|nr:response regulator transcription factor [Lachnospiraceae bacterium]